MYFWKIIAYLKTFTDKARNNYPDSAKKCEIETYIGVEKLTEQLINLTDLHFSNKVQERKVA